MTRFGGERGSQENGWRRRVNGGTNPDRVSVETDTQRPHQPRRTWSRLASSQWAYSKQGDPMSSGDLLFRWRPGNLPGGRLDAVMETGFILISFWHKPCQREGEANISNGFNEAPQDGRGLYAGGIHAFDKAMTMPVSMDAKGGSLRKDRLKRLTDHIWSSTSMPRTSNPCLSTRPVSSHSNNRLARVSPSDFSTGQLS